MGSEPLRPYTTYQISKFNLVERGVRDGESLTESFDGVSSTATRKVFCSWKDRYNVIRYLLGDVDYYKDGLKTKLTRLIPQTHPKFNEWIAVKLSEPIKGWKYKDYGGAVLIDSNGNPLPPTAPKEVRFPWDGRTTGYYAAELSILYEHVNYHALGDSDVADEMSRYLTFTPGEATEIALTSVNGVMKYLVDGGVVGPNNLGTPAPHLIPIPYGVPHSIQEETFELLWRRIPFDMFSIDSPLAHRIYGATPTDVPWLGCVNSNYFYGRPAGTVKFLRCKPTLGRSPLGRGWEWNINYTFLYRPQGHLSLRWFPPVTGPNAASAAGIYRVGTGTTVTEINKIPDYTSLACVRDLNRLFDVSDI